MSQSPHCNISCHGSGPSCELMPNITLHNITTPTNLNTGSPFTSRAVVLSTNRTHVLHHSIFMYLFMNVKKSDLVSNSQRICESILGKKDLFQWVFSSQGVVRFSSSTVKALLTITISICWILGIEAIENRSKFHLLVRRSGGESVMLYSQKLTGSPFYTLEECFCEELFA